MLKKGGLLGPPCLQQKNNLVFRFYREKPSTGEGRSASPRLCSLEAKVGPAANRVGSPAVVQFMRPDSGGRIIIQQMATKKRTRPKGKGILLPCIPHPHDLPLHVWRVMLAAEIARIYHPKSLAAIERGWKGMQKAAKWPPAVIDEVMDGSSYLPWVAQHGWDLDIRLAKAAKKKRRLTSD